MYPLGSQWDACPLQSLFSLPMRLFQRCKHNIPQLPGEYTLQMCTQTGISEIRRHVQLTLPPVARCSQYYAAKRMHCACGNRRIASVAKSQTQIERNALKPLGSQSFQQPEANLSALIRRLLFLFFSIARQRADRKCVCREHEITAQIHTHSTDAKRRAPLPIFPCCLQQHAYAHTQQNIYQCNHAQHLNFLFSSAGNILYNEEKHSALFQWRNL